MSETKKQRKKAPESSNSCPIPRRIDPKVQQEKGLKTENTRSQGTGTEELGVKAEGMGVSGDSDCNSTTQIIAKGGCET